MKNYLCSVLVIFFLLSLNGCKKEESNPTGNSSIVATEEWSAIMDNDSLNHGHHFFEKNSDGVVTTKGTFYYNYGGTEVVCPFINGAVTINDTVVTYTLQGTANNPAAPEGYKFSPFTFTTTGVAHNGQAYGNYTINFSTTGWPPQIQGTFTSVKISGSGITN